MGNHQIGITAEFVALIKSENNKKYEYFVSKQARNIYNFVSIVFSKKVIENIFQDRTRLSEGFDEFILKNDFDLIVEFGCGYSLRGLEFALKNKNKIYIDTDFKKLIDTKKRILVRICRDNKIVFPSNYFLLPLDVLSDNIYQELERYIGRKNLFLAEGLTSYFNLEEYSRFISQIKPLLSRHQSTFFSQENFFKRRPLTYRALRKMIVFLTKNKAHLKFKTKEDLVSFLNKNGFINCHTYYDGNNLFYRIN